MKVSTDNLMDPNELKDYLEYEIMWNGNFFAWEVHPNVLRASQKRGKRLRRKLQDLLDSEEYKEYIC